MLPFITALLTALLIQIGTNFANDVFDFQRGADTHQRLGPARITQSGQETPQRMLAVTGITFSLAALIGLYLVTIGGWPILLIGVLSILAGLAYTSGPFPLVYHGLGDPTCFIFFGPIAVTGSAWLQTQRITPLVMAVSIPVGLLVTAILIVNNVRDIDTDRAAEKRTLAVRLDCNSRTTFKPSAATNQHATPAVRIAPGSGLVAVMRHYVLRWDASTTNTTLDKITSRAIPILAVNASPASTTPSATATTGLTYA